MADPGLRAKGRVKVRRTSTRAYLRLSSLAGGAVSLVSSATFRGSTLAGPLGGSSLGFSRGSNLGLGGLVLDADLGLGLGQLGLDVLSGRSGGDVDDECIGVKGQRRPR